MTDETLRARLKNGGLWIACPFCGDSDQDFIDDGNQTAIECLACGARGPSSEKGERDSLAEWNDRAEEVFVPDDAEQRIADLRGGGFGDDD